MAPGRRLGMAIGPPSSCRTGTFWKAARIQKPDTTLHALCDRLLAERRVKADASMMSRFFRRIGVTFKETLVASE